ncbi:MAG TPA: alpha/beta hydrolase [Nitrososphaerales archaeon]|nr:alpha/beta hydrolase [Nitrososphaerales archaeon]
MSVAIRKETFRVPYPTKDRQVDLAVEERGEGGASFLLLHGGAGPGSMARFAASLAEQKNARVLTPTHPGFAMTQRPEDLNSVRALAKFYAAFLSQLQAEDVTVIGNSMGGWLGAELAILNPPGIRRAVLVGALGIEVQGHQIPDTSKLTLDEIMNLSYHNPGPFRVDPSSLTDVQRAAFASNRSALQAYASKSTDPTLLGRLAGISIPVLVVSGESDRIADAEYGRAYAAAIPKARFELLMGTGHLPQIETPELLLQTVWKFTQATQDG